MGWGRAESVTRCEVGLQRAARTDMLGLAVNRKAAMISFFHILKEKLEVGKKKTNNNNLKTKFTTSKIQVLLGKIRTQG